MNSFAIVFLYLLLVNSILLVRPQFPIWSGNYSIVNTANNPVCNQPACCCFTGPITITTAALSIALSSKVQGAQCDSSTIAGGNNNTTVTATFSLPSGFIAVPNYIGFTTGDTYILILSSDSNTLTINDTTNLQCGSMAQRVVVGNSTNGDSDTTNVSYSTTTIIAMSTTSQHPSGSNVLRYSAGCYLLLSLLVSMMAQSF